jgi:glutaryl-CoA dehydrogenase
VIGCFGLTEPDYGSNPSGMITMAREQSDGRGSSIGAQDVDHQRIPAQIAVVWAKTNDDKSDESIRGFVIPTTRPGFTAKDQKGKLSLRA